MANEKSKQSYWSYQPWFHLADICLKLTIETLQEGVKYVTVNFVNFEHISHFVLVFLLLTLRREMLAGQKQQS